MSIKVHVEIDCSRTREPESDGGFLKWCPECGGRNGHPDNMEIIHRRYTTWMPLEDVLRLAHEEEVRRVARGSRL